MVEIISTLLIKESAWAGGASAIMVSGDRGKILKNLKIRVEKIIFFDPIKIFTGKKLVPTDAVFYVLSTGDSFICR